MHMMDMVVIFFRKRVLFLGLSFFRSRRSLVVFIGILRCNDGLSLRDGLAPYRQGNDLGSEQQDEKPRDEPTHINAKIRGGAS